MQRNGKSPHSTTAVLQVPDSPLQVPDSPSQMSASLLQASDSPLQASDSPSQASDSPLQVSDSPLQVSDSRLQASDSPARTSRHRLNIYRTDAPIERRFMAARVTIETLLADPKFHDALAPYGYDMTRMLQGQALYNQALALVQQQRVSIGDRFAAADSRTSAQEQVHAIYKRHVALARIALRDDRGAAQKLDLAARKRTLAG